jgi:hypothetical protein
LRLDFKPAVSRALQLKVVYAALGESAGDYGNCYRNVTAGPYLRRDFNLADGDSERFLLGKAWMVLLSPALEASLLELRNRRPETIAALWLDHDFPFLLGGWLAKPGEV